ncbi:hypothetical protein J6590_073969 [Homalodisca vitripennis]|nr:hypothetical protein J6590_073969 [Homalodisca vitripennis]
MKMDSGRPMQPMPVPAEQSHVEFNCRWIIFVLIIIYGANEQSLWVFRRFSVGSTQLYPEFRGIPNYIADSRAICIRISEYTTLS